MSRPDATSSASTAAHRRATAILDYHHPLVQSLLTRATAEDELTYLRNAHALLRSAVRPVYTVDELQPVSVTLAKECGSCSQRFACLEAVARAAGIATRVRGLWVAGRFWNPRFRLSRAAIPSRILLAWPQFYMADQWLSVEALYGPPARLAEANPRAFANVGQSLFDALDHTALDFTGETAGCADGACDLSRFVVEDAGLYDSRDDLFAATPLLQTTLRGRAFEWVYGGRKSC